MAANGQTPMGGPATPMLTPDELRVVWEVLYAYSIGLHLNRPKHLLLTSAQDKIQRHLEAREAWAADAAARKLQTSR